MLTTPFQTAEQFLSQVDDDWSVLISTVGQCHFEPSLHQEPYEALIRAVAFQQLHAKAGEAIINRLCAFHENSFPLPTQLLKKSVDDLRACGFSARKIATLQDIANGTISGLVPSMVDASTMSDDALIERLVTLKGIGRWTVEMLLMFNLGRLDILPADDFAIGQGIKRLKKLSVVPKPKEIRQMGLAWQPYRTIASWYLWRIPK